MSVIEHQTVRLISGSTRLESGVPVDADAVIEINGFQGIHHRDIAKLVDAAPDLLKASKLAVARLANLIDADEAVDADFRAYHTLYAAIGKAVK